MTQDKILTKKCKYCSLDIPYDAKVCPYCKKNPNGMGSLKWVIIVVAAFFVFGVIASIGSKNDDTQQESGNGVASESQDPVEVQYIEITATELIDSYDDNQVKCKQLYDDQDLKVTGTVKSMGTDILDHVYVSLGHDTRYVIVGIQCYAKDKDTENQIAELKEGDVITVVGKGDCGSLSFSLKNAEILEILEQ